MRISEMKWHSGPLFKSGGELWGGPSSHLHPFVLAAAVALIQVVGTAFAAEEQPHREPLGALGYALLLVGPVALIARRRRPVTVLAITQLTTVAYLALSYPDGPMFLSVVVAIFVAVTSGHRRAAWAFSAAGFVGGILAEVFVATAPEDSVGDIAAGAAWTLVVIAVAEVTRARRERFLEATHARAEEQRRHASEERLQIAQELHDVVAHNISLINVQAGTALHLMDKQPEQARFALSAIREASNQALQELQSVLDVLRRRGEQAPRAPAPGMRQLDELVAGATAAGLTVHMAIEGESGPLPAAVDLAAFRIVQEALTNVIRHAGPATATISIDYAEHEVVVRVDDDGGGVTTTGSPGGNGIPGMRERVDARGGHLEVGSRPGGGFRVLARLPLEDR